MKFEAVHRKTVTSKRSIPIRWRLNPVNHRVSSIVDSMIVWLDILSGVYEKNGIDAEGEAGAVTVDSAEIAVAKASTSALFILDDVNGKIEQVAIFGKRYSDPASQQSNEFFL